MLSQREKAKDLYDLHHSGKLLILPNIWDCLGALLLEDIGYPAVATASASIALANGYDDGENIPFDELLTILKKITTSVDIPLTADIETGYADDDKQLSKNIRQLIEAGIAGINIEDTDIKTNLLLPVERQCERIQLITRVCKEMDTSLVINARTDVYIYATETGSSQNKLEATISRGVAYKAAGADCFYPVTMHDADDITNTIKQLQIPVNILLMPGVPQLNELQNMGVARVSLGPYYLKTAIQALRNLAVKLKQHQGLDEIKTNEITSAYLKNLVNKDK